MKIQCVLREETHRFKISQLYWSQVDVHKLHIFQTYTWEVCRLYTPPNQQHWRMFTPSPQKLPPASHHHTLCLFTALSQDAAVHLFEVNTRMHGLEWCVSSRVNRDLPVVGFLSLYIIISRFIHILVDNNSYSFELLSSVPMYRLRAWAYVLALSHMCSNVP